MRVGYARVSTRGQSLEVQKEALAKAGCERIYEEKASGAASKKRPALDEMLRFIREGDVLVITRLDRLGRSVVDLANIAQKLQTQGVGLVVLDQPIDTTTAAGRMTFTMLAAMAEFERELILDRAQEGRNRARKNGVRFGAKPKLTPEQLRALKSDYEAASQSRAALATRYGISQATLYRLVAE